MTDYRTEHDSMGEMMVPKDALYGAQTARAMSNFNIKGPMPKDFINALINVKKACASANLDLNLIEQDKAYAIVKACDKVLQGDYSKDFLVDIYQTGSGTSSNMNANEVLANLANRENDLNIHPNDHINMSQSSNDVIPTTIHVSAAFVCQEKLLPSLEHLLKTINDKANSLKDVTKTGRTHLMDAMPVTFYQELSGYSYQVNECINNIKHCLNSICNLAIGGTAVGTGINAHADFADKVCLHLSKNLNIKFSAAKNKFALISSQDAITQLSGCLKTYATVIMKIANDLRLANSGPLAGIGEISLESLQPGSSIMPGKVNPVIPEASCMVAAKVMGNDVTINVANQAGNFQLNVMLPVIADTIIDSINILANVSLALADKAIKTFSVNQDKINQSLNRNPILVTALNRVIGYELGAKIAKTAYQDGRAVREVALEMTKLSEEELDKLLDPKELTKGGV